MPTRTPTRTRRRMRGRAIPAAAACACLFAGAAAAVEFEAYDYSRWSQAVTECDLLAAHGRDPGAVAPAVSRDAMDPPAAIEACTAAVAADPDNPRLNYQLGRAYGYAGRGEEAMPYRLKAVAQDYPQSLFVIGYLHLLGQTIEQDRCRARDLWVRSARYQRLAALVALPKHELDGDFAACGAPLPRGDLRAYLERARDLSGDYYVGLLIDELFEELGQAGSDEPS